ncbi:bifunctional diguanylate cyclase/phosphodiesterase [Kineococcus glutinatus]|uniref:Diguanylate cyclase (GGDEF)-like protein n=1 Tax=Kineococcus glutinatus TaxID=1070872 RepID=A0ABP9HI28_9ACTN
MSAAIRRPAALVALAALPFAAYTAVFTATGDPGGVARVLWTAGLVGVLLLAVRRPLRVAEDRAAWTAVACAVAAWVLGDLVGTYLVAPSLSTLPTASDAVFYLLFPSLLLATALLGRRDAARGDQREETTSTPLDGPISALGAAALVGCFVVAPVWPWVGTAVATAPAALVYPALDVVCALACLHRLRRAGGTRRHALLLLAAAALLLAAADTRFLVRTVDPGAGKDVVADVLWAGTLLVLAAAGNLLEHVRTAPRSAAAPTFAAGVGATLVLALAPWTDVPPAAVVLATAAVVLCLLRLVIVVRQARALADAQHRALRDAATGLATARGVAERLEAMVEQAAPFAVVLLDVSSYKQLRLSLGSRLGGELITQIAARLRAATAGGELVGRAGEDEFTVVVPLRDDPQGDRTTGVRRAGELVRCFDEAFALEGITVHARVTAGVATFPDDGTSAAELQAAVELSTSHGSVEGAQVSAYSRSMEDQARVRLALAGEIGEAFAGGQVVAHLQPQVRLGDGRVLGAEALVRWQHPRMGILTPDRFLPAVQHTNLMRRVTDTVLRQAAAQAVTWRPWGMTVAVNLSPSDLLDPELPDRVSGILAAAGALPAEVRLEVTEDAVMADADRIAETLAELRRRGLRIAVDDFGQGHSSLARLRELPFDELKIDRAFLWRGTDPTPAETAIVRAAVALAKDLSLEVVAEGLETPDAWERLRDMGCDAVQGYWVSRPLAPHAFGGFLDGWAARVPGAAGAHLLG